MGQAWDEKKGFFFSQPLSQEPLLYGLRAKKKNERNVRTLHRDEQKGPASSSYDLHLQTGVTWTVYVVQRLTQGQNVLLKAVGDIPLH